jgi:hypothetical protein
MPIKTICLREPIFVAKSFSTSYNEPVPLAKEATDESG